MRAPTGAGRFIPRKHGVGYKYLLGASLPLLFDVVLLFTSNPLPLLLFLSSLLSPLIHSCLRAKMSQKGSGEKLGDPGTAETPWPAASPALLWLHPAAGEGEDLCPVGVPAAPGARG